MLFIEKNKKNIDIKHVVRFCDNTSICLGGKMGRTALIAVFVLMIIAGAIFVSLSEKQFLAIDSIIGENYSKQARHLANTYAHDAIRILNNGNGELVFDEEFNVTVIREIKNQEILGIKNASVRVVLAENIYNNSVNAFGKTVSRNKKDDTILESGRSSISSTAIIVGDDGKSYEATTNLIYRRKPYSEYQLFIQDFPSGSHFTGIDEFDGPVYVGDRIRIKPDEGHNPPIFNDYVQSKTTVSNFFNLNLSQVFKNSLRDDVSELKFPDFNRANFIQSQVFQHLDPYIMTSNQNVIELKGNNLHIKGQGNVNLNSQPVEGKIKGSGNKLYDPVIYSPNDIYVYGAVDFPLTIISGSNIYIRGNLTYGINTNQVQDPRSNPNTKGLLGLISNNDIILETNTTNANATKIDVMAVMMTPYGSFRINENDIKRSSTHHWFWGTQTEYPPFRKLKDINFIGSRIHKTFNNRTFTAYRQLTGTAYENFLYRYDLTINMPNFNSFWHWLANRINDFINNIINWLLTGKYNSNDYEHGVFENNYYDPRLKDIAPPGMPTLPSGNIIMWEEVPVVVR